MVKIYNSKVLLILLIGLLGLILCPAYANAACPNPSHPASDICQGTFADNAQYTFPQNLVVSGSLGVGVASPTIKLEVVGNINATGNVNSTNMYSSRWCSKTQDFCADPNANYFQIRNKAGTLFQGLAAQKIMIPQSSSYIDSSGNYLSINDTDAGVVFPTGNVGIGTTSPDTKLEVIGSVISDFADNGGEGAYYLGNSNHGISRDGQNTVNIFTSSGGNEGAIRLNTDGSTRVFIANGTGGGGNVGIGTTSPGAKLHISGPVNTPKNLRIEDYEGGEGILIQTENGWDRIRASDGLILDQNTQVTGNLHTDGNLYVDGNAGIGTTNPQEKFHVVGNARLESGQVRFYTPGADTGGSTGIVGNSNGWTRIDPNGQRFIITPTAAQVSAGANILDIEDPSWNHKMELRADGGAYFAGSVGIGTISPSQKLDVSGQIHATGDICTDVNGKCLSAAGAGGEKDKDTARAAGLAFWELNSYNNNPCDAGSYPREFASSDLTGTITGSQVCTFASASCTRVKYMYAWGSGGGQGEYAPSNKSCSDTITKNQIWPYTFMSYDQFNSPEYGGGWEASTYVVCCNDKYTAPKDEYVSGSLMVNGNVGIGTASPGDKLHVVGNIRIDSAAANNIRFGNNAGNTGGVVWGSTGYSSYYSRIYDDGQLYISSDDNIIFSDIDTATGAKGTEWMRIADGSVGIGTASPAYKLDVSGGDTRVNNFYLGGTGNEGDIYKADQIYGYDDLRFYGDSAGGPDMYIASGGNVGIGTTSPSQKLHVAGNIRVESLVNCNTIDTDTNGNFACGTDEGAGGGGGWTEDAANNKVYVTNTGRNVGIGTASPGAKLEISSGLSTGAFNIKEQQFDLGGSTTSFYPVIFRDDSWGSGETVFELIRPDVHTNGPWTGSLMSKFTFHGTSWGHGSNFVYANINEGSNRFIADYQEDPYGTRFAVWLRGGRTYYFRPVKGRIIIEDYSAGAKSYTYGASTWTLNVLSNIIDSEVFSGGESLGYRGLHVGGNVGIGTTTPSARLTVSQANSHEVAHFVQTTPASNNVDVWWKGGATSDWMISKRTVDGSGDLLFYTPGAGGNVLTLKQSGNVGIGATNPQSKLDVNGDVRLNGVIKSASGNVIIQLGA